MTLKKGFLNTKKPKIEISKIEIIVGLVLGTSFSFILYFFLKLSREILRVMGGILHYQELLVLDEKSLNFYNFFYAFIAVLFAQSILMTYWLDKPKKIKSRFDYKRNTIINDHRLTSWYFLHWFAKVGLTFGLVAIDSYTYNIFPKYAHIFILVAIVLFLQVWLSFRLIYKNKSIKWIGLSFITVIILSFLLSKINIVDYERINEKILLQNEYYRHNINIPSSSIYNRANHYNLLFDIYIAENDTKATEPKLIINQKEIELNDLGSEINYNSKFIHKQEIPYINYRLHVDNDIKMKYLSRIKNELINNEIEQISYAVRPSNTSSNIPFYHQNNQSFTKHKLVNELNNNLNKTTYQINIELSDDVLLLNKTNIELHELKNRTKQLLTDDLNYLLVIHADEDLSFGRYFKVLLTFNEGLNELRNDHSLEIYSVDYRSLSESAKTDRKQGEKLRKIGEKYQLNVMEVLN